MAIGRRAFLASMAAAGGATALRGADEQAQDRTAGRTPPRTGGYKRVIDAHAHWYAPEFVALLETEGAANGAKIIGRDRNGELKVKVPEADAYSPNGDTFRKDLTDVETIIKQMDERQVDMYALSMTHPMVYWASPEFGLKLSRVSNDACSAACVKYPTRFVGTIMLPLQDPKLAVQEVERAAKLPGMRAINLAEHINGKNLCDKSFWPVWERCEALGLPLFLHNLNPTDGARLVEKDFSMINVLGNPFEAGIAAEALVLGGVLDAFPKLDVYLPHAGGTFPWLVGRTDYAMLHNHEFTYMKQPASAYLRRFHYDIIMHNPQLLRVLIDMVGVERVVMGTDFPQGMAVQRPVETVESIPGVTRRECEMILSENPARLLKI